jgi:hypothetical protein
MFMRALSSPFPVLVSALASGVASLLATAGALASEPPAEPERPPPERFGEAGQLAISGSTVLEATHSTSTTVGGQSDPTSNLFFVSAGAQVFVVRGLSVGARLSFDHLATPGSPDWSSLYLGPTLGYDVRLGDHFSFWPTAYVSYGEFWDGAGGSGRQFDVGAYAPLLWHPGGHVFAGFGPTFATMLSSTFSDAQGTSDLPLPTTFGVEFTLGGWVAL